MFQAASSVKRQKTWVAVAKQYIYTHHYNHIWKQSGIMGAQAISNAVQKSSNAVSKAIKNKAKLKYGTFVYLINSHSNNKEK